MSKILDFLFGKSPKIFDNNKKLGKLGKKDTSVTLIATGAITRA